MGPPAGTVAPEMELRWAASPPPPSHDRHHFHQHHHPVSPLARQQRKGTATRAWLVVPESGAPRMEELGRHSVMRRAGIPARDLRILDPALSYPSTVLGRERAIVVNLEHVKVIITATEVLVPNSKDPLVVPFVRELQLRVSGGERNPPRGLEMLLEAYFVRADGTLNKLSALKDYVDDTEDYINIMLDDKQNQLLQVHVVLVAATMILSAGIVAVGLLGMNIHIGIFDSVPSKFWETAIGTFASCVVLFVTGVAWGKRNGILS